jgi:hypothetical protein
MRIGFSIGPLCLLLLVSCSTLLFMQQPACAAAELSAQQATSAATAAARQVLNKLERAPLAGNDTLWARGYGAVQDATNWDTLARKLSQPGESMKPVTHKWAAFCTNESARTTLQRRHLHACSEEFNFVVKLS